MVQAKKNTKHNSSGEIKGLTICYFGNGKGKTTAALGLALRAAGRGKKVSIIQFIKGDWQSGEDIACKNINSIRIKKMGKGFVGLGNRTKASEHTKSAENALSAVDQAFIGKSDIIVADEILGAIKGKLISEKNVIELIKNKPPQKTLVLTGQPEYCAIINCCDLVTQMTKIKHPYDQGIQAIEGIDY